MYTVDDVKTTITGVGGKYGFGFNILDNRRPGQRPLLSLSYKTREEAETARELVTNAIENAIDIM